VSGRLPAQTAPFFGRGPDLARVQDLLRQGRRLVTLWGPGGIGKTRAALQAARAAPLQALLAELAGARDETALCAEVARALGIPLAGDPAERVEQVLSRRGELLVVLDNFEQLVDLAPATVGRWLAAAPGARFLVTSRERLRLPGEVAVELGPLSLPGGVPAGESEAVQVFLSCADLPPPGETELARIARLVTALEGIPLAIELAASRVPLLGLAGVLKRLPRRLDLLSAGSRGAAPRQATLRGAIAWSWELLSPDEQRALARCAVFRGEFSPEAAAALLAGDEEDPGALALLQSLRDRSLLRAPGPGRLALYVSVRDFAWEQLEAAGLAADTWRRFADGLLARAAPVVEAFRDHGTQPATVLEARADLLAALEWSLAAADRGRAAALAGAAGVALSIQGPATLHVALLERALTLCPGDPRLLQDRARARLSAGDLTGAEHDLRAALQSAPSYRREGIILRDLGVLHHHRREMDRARRFYEQALEVHREVGDRRAEGVTVGNLGAVHHDLQQYEAASERYGEALRTLRAVGDTRLTGIFLTNLGVLTQERGDHSRAEQHFLQGLALLEEAGDTRYQAITLGNLGALRQLAGDPAAARERYQQALPLCAEAGDLRTEALCRVRLGGALAALGELAAGAEQLDAAQVLTARISDALTERIGDLFRAFLDLGHGDTAAVRRRLAAARAPGDGPALTEISEDARTAVRLLEGALARLEGPALTVGEGGAWFALPGADPAGEAVDVSRYAAASRLLAALADARVSAPGEGLGLEALFEAGWPGERVDAGSASNRVYVALNRLRKLGLRPLILRSEQGWCLDPGVTLRRG
jgi:predicted ATPase/Tfp pilus assembly protein PilF